MMFPMDLASDMTTLIGPINGTLWNGASIIPGVTGTAFYTGAGAGYLDIGIHPGSGCLYYPDDCPDGISIALWLKIYELPSQDPFSVVINNGGCRLNLIGYCLFVRPDAIGFVARHRIPGSVTRVEIVPLHQWYHITVSHTENHTVIYVNGCPDDTIFSNQWQRISSILPPRGFFFGCMDVGIRHAHVAMDQMAIWYRALSADDIWKHYVNMATW